LVLIGIYYHYKPPAPCNKQEISTPPDLNCPDILDKNFKVLPG